MFTRRSIFAIIGGVAISVKAALSREPVKISLVEARQITSGRVFTFSVRGRGDVSVVMLDHFLSKGQPYYGFTHEAGARRIITEMVERGWLPLKNQGGRKCSPSSS